MNVPVVYNSFGKEKKEVEGGIWKLKCYYWEGIKKIFQVVEAACSCLIVYRFA